MCRYAFIEYETEAEAASAMKQHNSLELDGRKITIAYAGSQPSAQESEWMALFRTLYTYNEPAVHKNSLAETHSVKRITYLVMSYVALSK